MFEEKNLSSTAKIEYNKYVSMWNKKEISVLQLADFYFNMRGCFVKDKKTCPINGRFHFIDIRQKYFGNCTIGVVRHHADFYDHLFQAFDDNDFETFVDNIISSLNELLNHCSPDKTKVMVQIAKSEISDKVMDFFEEKISKILELMKDVLKIWKEGREQIIDSFKTDLINDTISTGDLLSDKYKSIDLFDRFDNIDSEFKSHRKLNFVWEVMFIFSVTLMDMYALGRMTKPYNKNIIVLAGMNHIFQYQDFFLKNGWKTEWSATQINTKCSLAPDSLFSKALAGGGTRCKTRKTRKTRKT
jgi:hypothetical protein